MTSLYASEIERHFSNLKCDVKELFPDATYAHLTGFLRCASRDICSNFCAFREQRFAVTAMVYAIFGAIAGHSCSISTIRATLDYFRVRSQEWSSRAFRESAWQMMIGP